MCHVAEVIVANAQLYQREPGDTRGNVGKVFRSGGVEDALAVADVEVHQGGTRGNVPQGGDGETHAVGEVEGLKRRDAAYADHPTVFDSGTKLKIEGGE